MTDIDVIRERHVKVVHHTNYGAQRTYICGACGEPWGENGCDTRVVLDALDVMRQNNKTLGDELLDSTSELQREAAHAKALADALRALLDWAGWALTPDDRTDKAISALAVYDQAHPTEKE